MPAELSTAAARLLTTWRPPDEHQAGLRAAYLRLLVERADGCLRDCHPDHLTASALVVDDTGNRVLLTLHRRLRRWLQTGGHCEPGDAGLAEAAHREASEESGIAGLRLDPAPLRLDRHLVPCGPVRPAHHLDVQFLAVAPAGAVPRISAESADLAWFATDALPDGADASVRVLVLAAQARRGRRQPSSPQGSPEASETPSR